MTVENRKKITEVLKRFPEVKRYQFAASTVFVFYGTDKDIVTNRENGLSRKIYEEIRTVFDDATVISGHKFVDVRFSSLETFEGEYGGNFHGFWLDH